MASRPWNGAALPARIETRSGDVVVREPETVALAPGTPTLAALFSFMRDAELRFQTLKMRIEERTFGARGEQLVIVDVAVRHPGHARVITSEPGPAVKGTSELWISDGATVRTYSTPSRVGTERAVRNRPRGLDDGDFPGFARVYEPLTPLPMQTLAELFVHPAGYCQNVLSTGRCWISGTDVVAGREAIVVECDHPRSVEVVADRPDFHIQVAADRGVGLITRLVESVGGELTRLAEVVALDPDASLPPGTFEFAIPEDATKLY